MTFAAHASSDLARKRPVRLLVVSDLHLERGDTFERTNQDEADVVLLAGDIHVGVHGISWARKTFPDKPIVYVAGNHEYYGHQWDTLIEELRIEGRRYNVNFLENEEVNILGLRFLGSTLWTDFKFFGVRNAASAMAAAQRGLDDYQVIGKNVSGLPINAQDTLERHEESSRWMKTQLSVGNPATTVVVTHHYPCRGSTDPQYKDDALTAAYGSRLDKLIGKSALWAHGHTHTTFNYMHKGTRVICNPKGYTSRGKHPENHKFNPNLIIEVSSQ